MRQPMTNGLALLVYWSVRQKLNHVSSVQLHRCVRALTRRSYTKGRKRELTYSNDGGGGITQDGRDRFPPQSDARGHILQQVSIIYRPRLVLHRTANHGWKKRSRKTKNLKTYKKTLKYVARIKKTF